MQKRINVSISPKLHEEGKVFAVEVHNTDFSGLVTILLTAAIKAHKSATNSPVERDVREMKVKLDALDAKVRRHPTPAETRVSGGGIKKRT